MLPCGEFLSHCSEDLLDLNCQTQTFFAMGYISALSWESDKEYSRNVFNTENIKHSLIKYCRDNPLKDTHDGAEFIFFQMQ